MSIFRSADLSHLRAGALNYLPYALNMKDRARFEALGWPVDKTKLWAMLPK